MTQDLIARLEAAEEGSRELDAAIAEEVHPLLKTYAHDTERGPGHWISPKDGKVYALDYTTSLDAALTLVPEGFSWFIEHIAVQNRGTRAFVSKVVEGEWIPNSPREDKRQGLTVADFGFRGNAVTPALALTTAALKARRRA